MQAGDKGNSPQGKMVFEIAGEAYKSSGTADVKYLFPGIEGTIEEC